MIRLYVQVTLVGTTALRLLPVMKEGVTVTRTVSARVAWCVVLEVMIIQTTAGTSILRLKRRLTAASNHENPIPNTRPHKIQKVNMNIERI